MSDGRYPVDSKSWTAAQKREYNQLIQDAYADGYAKGNPKLVDERHSVLQLVNEDDKNLSPTNAGAKAAYLKQVELTGYDIGPDSKLRGF